MANGLQGKSTKKTVDSKRKDLSSQNKKIVWFARFIIVVGLLNAVATIPQVLQIWVGKDATGVSLLSWSYYTFYTAMFLLYGIVHRELVIVISYSASLILFVFIVVGTAIYS